MQQGRIHQDIEGVRSSLRKERRDSRMMVYKSINVLVALLTLCQTCHSEGKEEFTSGS